MRNIYLLLSLILVSCSENPLETQGEASLYQTSNDSTLHYYHLGWHQILNQGFYGPAEISYRKALSFDSTFLVGQSVLARLTEDLQERQQFYDHIYSHQNSVKGDEGDLLAVFLSLMEYTLIRAKDPEKASLFRPEMLAAAQTLLCGLRQKHPNIDYIESECVEFIHAIHGATAALDSMSRFRSQSVVGNAFLAGYKAMLLAELEQFPEALALANKLSHTDKGEPIPRPDVILAHVYAGWGKWEEAKMHVDKAVNLDPRNLEATRLQKRILDNLATVEKSD